jgi:hypothetical protein
MIHSGLMIERQQRIEAGWTENACVIHAIGNEE